MRISKPPPWGWRTPSAKPEPAPKQPTLKILRTRRERRRRELARQPYEFEAPF